MSSIRLPRSKRPRRRPEEALQRECVVLLERYVPPPPEGPAWTAINPVPAKSKAVAGVSKAMGLRPGWMDILLIQAGRPILIEFKSSSGRLSANQRKRKKEIEAAGGTVTTARSVDEFLAILDEQGVPLTLPLIR